MNNNESKKLDAAAKRYIWLGLIAILLNLSLTTLGLVYPFAGSWSLIWVISPILVLILYGLIGFRLSGGNSQLLYRYSESSYFLGYFTTIISLIAVTLDISKDPNPLGNLGLILHKGAGAIFATVAGLFMMFWLRIHAQSREISENYTAASAPMAGVSGSSLTPETIALIEKFNSKLSATLEEFLITIEEYNSRFKKSFDKFLSPIETIGSKLPEFQNFFDKVSSILPDLEKTLEAAADYLKLLSNYSEAFQKSITALNTLSGNLLNLWQQINEHMKNAIEINEKLSSFKTNLDSSAESLESLASGLKKANDNMSEYNKASSDYQQRLLDAVKVIDDRVKTIGDLAGLVEKFSKAAESIAKPLEQLENNVETLSKFNNLLDQVNTNINNLNTSLASTTINYTDSTNAYGELKVVISNFVTEFSNQLAKLNDLTTNLSNLGVQITNFQQHMNTLIKISENISNLTKSISDLQTSFSNLNTDVHGVGKNMSDVKNVITDFVETSRNILTHMGNDIS